MKVTEIKLTYGETIRPKDYESRKCEMEVHVQLEETDDVKKVTDSVLFRLKEKVRKQLRVGKPDLGDQLNDAQEEMVDEKLKQLGKKPQWGLD